MRSNDIKQGETYMFVATDSPTRKHLEGQPFTVQVIKNVWRRSSKRSKLVRRFFNDAGDAARADELEPIDQPATEDAPL